MTELNLGDMRTLANVIAQQLQSDFIITNATRVQRGSLAKEQDITDVCFEAIKEYFGA